MQLQYRDVRDKHEKLVKLIFKKVYYCKVPYLASLTDEEIELYGLPYLNDREYDNYVYNQDIDCALTINSMVELFKRGVDVRLRQYADTLEIYDTIVDYLELWKQRIEWRIAHQNVPYEDLEALDQLASKLHPYAVNQTRLKEVSTGLRRAMQTSGLFSTRALLSKVHQSVGISGDVIVGPAAERVQQEQQHYQSLTEAFQQRRAQQFQSAYDFSPAKGSTTNSALTKGDGNEY